MILNVKESTFTFNKESKYSNECRESLNKYLEYESEAKLAYEK